MVKSLNVSDNSVIAIPLRNLIGLIAGVGIAVYGYFGVTERLNFIEKEASQHASGIADLEEWVEEWVSGGELKADILQDQRILVLQRDLEKIETRIDQLEK